MDGWTYGHVGSVVPRWGGDDERQGAYIRCRIVEEFIRGEKRRWKVISMVWSSLGVYVVLVMRGDVMRGYALQRQGTLEKQNIYGGGWMGWTDK